MAKVKWSPWSNLDEFRQQVERLAGQGACSFGSAASGYVWSPLADLLETPAAFIAQVELPGVNADQVVVEILDGDLVVRGERPCQREEPEPAYHVMERAHGTFARRFPLPPGIDGQAIRASLSDGLLSVIIPKPTAKAPQRFSLIVE